MGLGVGLGLRVPAAPLYLVELVQIELARAVGVPAVEERVDLVRRHLPPELGLGPCATLTLTLTLTLLLTCSPSMGIALRNSFLETTPG